MNSIPAEKQSVLALRCLETNVVGTEVYSAGSLDPLKRRTSTFRLVTAHYHKVDLISTLLDVLIVQNVLRRSRRSSPLALIENE